MNIVKGFAMNLTDQVSRVQDMVLARSLVSPAPNVLSVVFPTAVQGKEYCEGHPDVDFVEADGAVGIAK